MAAIGGLGTGRLAQLTSPDAASTSVATDNPQRKLSRKPVCRKAAPNRRDVPNSHRRPNHRAEPAVRIEVQSDLGPKVLTIRKTLPMIDSVAKRNPLCLCVIRGIHAGNLFRHGQSEIIPQPARRWPVRVIA
jgi:hypothetical protein